MLAECGVAWIGFPLRLPVNTEDTTEDEAAEIVRDLAAFRGDVTSVLITYLSDPDEITAFARTLGVTVVQLHGDVPVESLRRLREESPELHVVKSLVVGRTPDRELDRLVGECSPSVDAFITDTFDPATGASGATGRVHDWAVSRRIVERSPRPVILAGGLTPENVREAVHVVRPAGVDVHTGVEDATGRKDRRLVEAFVAEARAAFAETRG